MHRCCRLARSNRRVRRKRRQRSKRKRARKQVLKPMLVLPVIKTFTIPSLEWTVTDFRNLKPGEQVQAETRWTDAVVVHVEAQGIDKSDVLCKWSRPKQDQEAAEGFERAYKADPKIDYAEYHRANPSKRFRFHPGNERRGAFLGVVARGRIIGGIYVSNYSVEEETERKLTVRSMLWVGVEDVPRKTELDVWMEAIEFMIDNDMELDDGRTFDVIGYDFVSDVHMKDGFAARAPLKAFVDRMAVKFETSNVPDERGDVQYRRRGAPPRPAEPVGPGRPVKRPSRGDAEQFTGPR